MIKKVKKFFNESLYRARIANSQDLEYENRNTEAISLLKKYEYIAQNNIYEHIEYFLIRSRLYHKIGNYEYALKDALSISKYLEDKKDFSDIYTSIDILYLKKYLFFLLKMIYQSLDNEKWKYYESKYKVTNYSQENMNELNQIFLQWLPLPTKA